jgi:hypothetical protein
MEYVFAASPEKTFPGDTVDPLLMEYSNGPCPPVALMVIEPSLMPGQASLGVTV